MERWHHRKYTRRHLHSSYDFRRRKNNKGKYLFILLVILFGFAWVNDQGYLTEVNILNNNTNSSVNNLIENIKNTVTVPEKDYDIIENRILELVNEERGRYNVRTLAPNSNLDNFARSWSDKMINESFFEHSNLNFYFPSTAGENIGETPIHYNVEGCGATYTNNAIAECFVDGWIGSPGHHKNMIGGSFYMTGIGVSCDFSKCRATQVFSG